MPNYLPTRDFLRDERGSIATIFGLATIPLLMATGMAVDYTRASAARSELQNAADSAVLALATNSKTVTNTETLKTLATNHMAGMLPDWYDFEVTSITNASSTIELEAAGSLEAGISGVLGISTLGQSVTSEAVWGAGEGSNIQKLELALVLDNTGSTAQYSRMTEMKKAATALLDVLKTSDPGVVKVAIVPFDVNVRVPTSYKSASWFKTDWWVNWLWKGCMTDRDQPNDVSDAAATSAASTKYPPALCSSDKLATLQPLTENFTDLYAKVNSMASAGNTNITIGLSWGLAALSAQEPLTQGAAWSDKNVSKVMILMTDGENTENRWTNSSTSIDARTKLACTAVKQSGVRLYTVRLMEGNASLLQGCASNDDSYYDVEDVDDLVPAFQSIGQELSQLRLTR